MYSQDNGESPYTDINQLLKDYGYREGDYAKASTELQFVKEIFKLKQEIEQTFVRPSPTSTVYAIQAPWGMGKTSFIHILFDELMNNSKRIDSQHLCKYYYDSLYYGSVSEAITTVMQQLFKRIEKQYAIRLNGVQDKIASNLTPSVEVNGILAKLSFQRKHTSDTKTLISEKIKNKLEHIEGKVLVVIDDIDRLTSTEALHMLRMIRVLKEIPNMRIFLPIDYDALVKMLEAEKVSNPGGYVRKIITKPVRLNARLSDLEIFFRQNFAAQLGFDSNEERVSTHLRDLWFGYLWELSLRSLTTLENIDRSTDRTPVRLQMGAPRNALEWEQADYLNSTVNGKNFLCKFFEHTARQYGASGDYLVKFKVNDDLFHFFRYRFLAPQTTFDRFFNGVDFTTSVGFGLDIAGGTNGFEMELYKEADLLAVTNEPVKAGENERYELNKAHADQLEPSRTTLWDLILSILEPDDLPKEIQKFVSPRMIRRLIEDQRFDKKEVENVIQEPRTSVNNLYKSRRSSIQEFIDDYAIE